MLVTTATFGADGLYILRLTVSDGAVTVSDDVTLTVNPPGSGGTSGSGLLGQYFNDPGTGARFVTPIVSRVDATVNFNWGEGYPCGPVCLSDNKFQIYWTGKIKAESFF